MTTYSTSGTADTSGWICNTGTITYPDFRGHIERGKGEVSYVPKEMLYPGLQMLIEAAEPKSLERQTMKGGDYTFEPKGTLEEGKIHGLIYEGECGPPIGEWTATVYELTDGISIQDLISNPRKDVPNMRGLFQVFVVDPDDESIVVRTEVIAKSYDGAKLRVLKDTELAKDVEDYDVFAIRIGDVRKKKEVQEVKIVGG